MKLMKKIVVQPKVESEQYNIENKSERFLCDSDFIYS